MMVMVLFVDILIVACNKKILLASRFTR